MRPIPDDGGDGNGPAPRVDGPRVLDTSRVWRFATIVLWSGFLGATTLLAVCLLFLQHFPMTDLAQLSRMFLVSWAACLVPAACAAILAQPSRHGH